VGERPSGDGLIADAADRLVQMAPPRKFDWEEARRLHVEGGLSFAEIGRQLGVGRDAVQRACNPKARARAHASALETMRRKRNAGDYRHHDLEVCPGCLGTKSRHGGVCRRCSRRDQRPEFAWRLVFWAEPDGSFSWAIYADQTDRVLQSGTAPNWDEARLATIDRLYPPGPELRAA
jgi:hypothetical protein